MAVDRRGAAAPPEDAQVLPDYGRSTLTELLPSLSAHLFSDGNRFTDVLDLPDAQRYVLVMVDGLGWQLLAAELSRLGWFSQVFGDAVKLTAAVPSTTATSLSCLGTGLPPGQHGIVGYTFRPAPRRGRLNALTWEDGPDPVDFQPNQTCFEALTADGVLVSSVSPERFESSGITQAVQRGTCFVPVADETDFDHRIELTVEASRLGDRSLVYVYERSLDHTGHGRGCRSQAWRRALGRIDGFLERLREALDPDVCLLVTGDHGMVDVPPEHELVFEDDPCLLAGVDLIAGEGRLRQLYTTQPDQVAARWQQVLGGRAWVLTGEQAIRAGWFGPVSPSVRSRIGDVVVAMRGDWAVMTRELPGEMSLVGMHGSLTSAEMYVPLLIDEGWPDARG